MSAATDLQAAVHEYLGRAYTGAVGDGVSRTLPVAHGLDTRVLTLRVAHGDTVLTEGQDFTATAPDADTVVVEIPPSASIPAAGALQVTCSVIRQPAGIAVPIVERREKSLIDKLQQAIANRGLCLNVMPPLPTRALRGGAFVFFESAVLRVRVIERPSVSRRFGCDAYDLIDDVATALHWRSFAMLGHPLQLAERPVEIFAEAAEERAFDVVFQATYGIGRTLPAA